MGAKLDAEDLKKALEDIFNTLEKSGLTTQHMRAQKESIIGAMSHQLKNKLDGDDLKDPVAQMRLMGAMVCKGLGLDQHEKSFMNSLEKNPKQAPTSGEKGLMTLLRMLNVLKPGSPKPGGSKPESLFEKMLRKMKELVMEKRSNKKEDPNSSDAKKEVDKGLDKLNDQLGESLRILEGGKDPRNADAIASVILCVAAGEQFNTTKQEASVAGASFLDDLTAYNSEKPDYTGAETNSLLAGITNGISSLTELNYSMGNTNTETNTSGSPTPLRTRPTPFD